MGLKIEIFGAERDSDEYIAACKLKEIIKRDCPNNVNGEIVLFASATLMGQAVKDIDLMMLGIIYNYKTKLFFNGGYERDEIVEIRSFCTTIEVKRHDITGVFVNGTDFYVKYGRKNHCVTSQSNKQKIAAMNFFKHTLGTSPYVTNLIWFTQISSNDIKTILTNNGMVMPTNVMGADFNFEELVQLLAYQKPPVFIYGRYTLDSNYNGSTVDDLKKALELFSNVKEHMGELTRRKIEQLTNKSLMNSQLIDSSGKISICRGRAGTGKTVGLIQTAIKLVDEKQARVLLLTYNKALVSDMRRLFALAELPDMFEENCVSVETMHSYFYALANKVLYNGQMQGEKFLSNYDCIMHELQSFLKDSDTVQLIKEELVSDAKLNWDYILIDEAQDWTDNEKEVVLQLFENSNIIVADGGLQFVRHINHCDWSLVKERKNIKLKYCLRQKENLISFLNAYTKASNFLGGKILSSDNMLGGKVVITTARNIIDIHKEEITKLKDAGNIAYDMLYLVPHRLVKKDSGITCFKDKKIFEENGINVWDGTSNQNRDSYSINSDEVRLLQYDSSRGLEGWTVVCMEFDTFLEEKEFEYVDGNADALLLESPEDRKRKYLYNWAMIPLTRAIDTLVITLRNEDSNVGKILKQLSIEYPDFVIWK